MFLHQGIVQLFGENQGGFLKDQPSIPLNPGLVKDSVLEALRDAPRPHCLSVKRVGGAGIRAGGA